MRKCECKYINTLLVRERGKNERIYLEQEHRAKLLKMLLCSKVSRKP